MTSHSELPVVPLTASAFAPFGQILDTTGIAAMPINDGSAMRFDTAARIDAGDARVGVSVFVGQPSPLPIGIAAMERHPLGSQTFMPMDECSYLVVVAPNGPDDKPLAPRAFLAAAGQGVNYPAGLWHHPLLALGRVSRFWVIDRSGPGENLETAAYGTPWRISAPLPVPGNSD